MRVALVVVLVAGLGGLALAPGAVFEAMDRDVGYTAVLAVVGLLWAALLVRALLLEVEVRADGTLFVRGMLGTRVFRREEVRDFRLPPAGLASTMSGHWIVLRLTDGSERQLEATATWPLPGRRGTSEETVERLNAWAADRSP